MRAAAASSTRKLPTHVVTPAVTVAPAADSANDKTGHTVTTGLGGQVVVVAADKSSAGLKSKLPARKTQNKVPFVSKVDVAN